MVEWFRSVDMKFVSLIIHEDAAHATAREIGNIGCIQFTDLNSELTPFQRRYVSSVKRCDELERKVRFFSGEIEKFGLPVPSNGSLDAFLAEQAERSTAAVHLLTTLEQQLETHETQLLELNSYNEKLTQEYNEKVELQEVLMKAQTFFEMDALPFTTVEDTGNPLSEQHINQPLLDGEHAARPDDEMKFSFVTGVLPIEDRARFERALFRNTRGNCFFRFAEIDQPVTDPHKGTLVHKLVFIVMFKSRAIEAKVKRICDAFGARRYAIPDVTSDQGAAIAGRMRDNLQELAESRKVLLKNRDLRLDLCRDLAVNIEQWMWTVVREKATYHTLNLFKVAHTSMLRADGWIVADQMPTVRDLIHKAHVGFDVAGSYVIEEKPQPWPTPPTHFILNTFTYPFQEFVDTYGVPRYKEANPALFTAVTFPFLFGLMYGDVGHGTCLTIAGIYLVMSYDPNAKGQGEMMGGLYAARYMIFMMGVFAVYAGFIYNDCFSIALNIFGSNWEWGDDPSGDVEANSTCSYTSDLKLKDADCIYPFGVDPAWHISDNELLFFNSMKMKTSVIIGILQMCLGIIIRGMNSLYFNDKVEFYLEFIPMCFFAFGLFGYMIVVIFIKWSIDWNHRMYLATCNEDNDLWDETTRSCPGDPSGKDLCPLDMGGDGDGCQPPNLITTLINIALSPGTVEEPMYYGQDVVQTIILLLAFMAVPVLLLGKPLWMKYHAKPEHEDDTTVAMIKNDDYAAELGDGEIEHSDGGDHDGHGDSFSEVVIHQAIETIEFVLGMVSNTASYLRLWALSLAHSELATVFWEKAMLTTIKMNNPVFIFVGYAVFASVTGGVLLGMDVLECFLHALRLHWVEFQNKFYKADGYKFMPFSLKPILKDAF